MEVMTQPQASPQVNFRSVVFAKDAVSADQGWDVASTRAAPSAASTCSSRELSQNSGSEAEQMPEVQIMRRSRRTVSEGVRLPVGGGVMEVGSTSSSLRLPPRKQEFGAMAPQSGSVSLPVRRRQSTGACMEPTLRRDRPMQAMTLSRAPVQAVVQRAESHHISQQTQSSDAHVFRQTSANSGLSALRQRARAAEAALQALAQLGPGDVLCVQGTGQIAQIGAVGGFLGHVLVLLEPPTEIPFQSPEGEDLRQVLPLTCQWPLWAFPTLECTSSVPGLHVSHQLVYVEESSGRFVLVGELRDGFDFTEYEDAVAEFWKAPAVLRSNFRSDILNKVVAEMMACPASWSFVTAMRAVLRSAQVQEQQSHSEQLETLSQLRVCWATEPICTSVVISFWQRYLCDLARLGRGDPEAKAAHLVLKWMPLKADRALPGELLCTMLKCGFTLLNESPCANRGRPRARAERTGFC
eukprot:gb/GFBE01000698.1/.p1 GENE.gb/GFBE01000698.1/~~gb/GFBE01000698.1/.p1  ORF type:complete len:467 (+),score=91.14 gb/GFBE01000698.1/:1-1401(+)